MHTARDLATAWLSDPVAGSSRGILEKRAICDPMFEKPSDGTTAAQLGRVRV